MSYNLHLLLLLGSLYWGVWAQQGLCANGIGFFDKLAQRDAIYEQSMRFSSEEDEQDYWNDQKQFELQIQQKNPKGYAAYIIKKHLIYNDHLFHCEDKHGHSNGYYKHAFWYAQQILEEGQGKFVLSL